MRTWPAALLFALLALILAALPARPGLAQDNGSQLQHFVEPGDTWTALAWRYGVAEEALRYANPQPNRQRQPVIGRTITIPGPSTFERQGLIINVKDGGLLQQAAVRGIKPWQVALLNGLSSPHHPLLLRPIYLPVGQTPVKHFPATLDALQFSQAPARPGQAIAIRGLSGDKWPINMQLAQIPLAVFQNSGRFVALSGTGAFFEPGDYELEIRIPGEPLWSQPWHFSPGDWTFEQITYTGAAAAIDAEDIRREREMLAEVWNQFGDQPLWTGPFALPLSEYLEISSRYGARRSYGGGPYDRYHEGLDFSAYGGTPVHAPAAGKVSLAGDLTARGGAVILDHGLGVFTGFYHLSEVLVEPGQIVTPGQIVGRVGTTGLSTGNHLHWDFLVAGTWVDPAAWLEQDLACWLLEGWGTPCSQP